MVKANRSKVARTVSKHKGAVAAATVGILAAAAATALLVGEKNAPRRKKLAVWAGSVKREVASELKRAKKINKQAYLKAISKVAARYKKFKNVDSKELTAFAADLRKHWNVISKEMGAVKKEARKYVKKSKR